MFECLVKQTKIMAHVENLNVDIMLLLQTNLCKSDNLKLLFGVKFTKFDLDQTDFPIQVKFGKIYTQ